MTNITITHPEIVKQWHPTKNGLLKHENFTKGSKQRIWWLCEKTCKEGCMHVWETTIKDRTAGYGCPFCSPNRLKICEHDSIVGTHLNVANQWHPTKNGDLKKEKFGSGSHKKVWWLCDKTCKNGCKHEWESVISSRCNGVGCPFCSKPQKQNCIHDSIIYTHPEIEKQWHPTKNGDLKTEDITFGNGKILAWWKCNKGECHEWTSTTNNRTRGNGCPFCAGQQICKQKKCDGCKIKTFASSTKVNYWNKTLNKEEPYEVFISAKESYWFTCDKCKHDFKSSLNNIYSGCWCPHCVNKTEQKLNNSLTTYYPQLAQQFKVEWCKKKTYLPFDFVLENDKIIIELDGPQHFEQISNWSTPEDTHLNDVYKMKCAKDNGYSIIRLLQSDVLYDRYDWLTELRENIEKIILENALQNIYMCKNKEYDIFM
jgi:very-short-patch-repair endonuclease